MEQHDLRFVDGDGMDRVREVGILDGDEGRQTRDEECIGVIVQVGALGKVCERVTIINKRFADFHGARRALRRGLFRTRRART